MEEEIVRYVQNQLVQAPFRLSSYIQDEQGKKYPHRDLYFKINEYFLNFFRQPGTGDRWMIIPGLRGVGKTTILAQLFLAHYQAAGERSMLYVSLDEVVNVIGSSLKDVLSAYERILGVSFEKLTRPIFIFIDEAQYDPKWGAVLKSVYDRSNKVFVVCSGSSAIALQTNPDVIRRSVFQKLFPTSFLEFLMIKNGFKADYGLKEKIKDALFKAVSAKDAYAKLKQLEPNVLKAWSAIDRRQLDEYFKVGTLPFAIRVNNEARVYQTITMLLDKVINQDAQSIGRFDAATVGYVKRILYLLAEAEILSLQNLAKILQTSVNTVSGILEVLTQAELLIRVMPYGSNSKKVRKPSRYQFMSSAMRSALLSVAGNEQIFASQKGKLLEDIVALTLFREFAVSGRGALSYDSSKGAADFILTLDGQGIIPIEVGLGDKTARQARQTMKKIKSAKYGAVVSSEPLSLLADANIVKAPLDYFLLI